MEPSQPSVKFKDIGGNEKVLKVRQFYLKISLSYLENYH